jgi:nucleoside-diphosphate-sugar epimerase
MAIYLLTGAAGFIGSKTAELLLKGGHSVVGIDNLNNYYNPDIKHSRIKALKPYKRFSFHPVDIENLERLQHLFKANHFTAVLNLAARAGVRYSMENPHIYFTTNVLGTVNLLELCREFGVKKFLLASTSSLYAGQKMPFKETLAVNTPISPYAASKKSAEAACFSWHHLYGIDVSIVRYFTVYGPHGRPDMSVDIFTRKIDAGKPIEVFGDGSQSRDFTYVDDIARGTIKALKNVGFEVFNLGSDAPYTLKHMIGLIEQNLGKKAAIIHKPFHIADIKATWADINKAKRLLKWKPQVTLNQGIKQTVDMYLIGKLASKKTPH